jgi:hypothetical protein
MNKITRTLAAAIAAFGLAQAAPAFAQQAFATPEEAAKALADAVRTGKSPGIIKVMGAKSQAWIFTGDAVSDREDWTQFLARYDKKNALARDGDAKAVLNVGEDDWPFPAPLVKKGGKWMFDAEAGREEVMNRRVGRNELDTIQTLLATVDAQREYASNDSDGNGFNDYARRFISTKGKKDGLYWATKDGEKQSPLGPLVASATSEGYGQAKASKPQPYHGYFYRILTSQGKDSPGGAYNYLVKDKLVGGFAVVAYPATYGNSGVKTFVVNHEGVVFEKDLGKSTASAAAALKAFNPDKTWQKVQ